MPVRLLWRCFLAQERRLFFPWVNRRLSPQAKIVKKGAKKEAKKYVIDGAAPAADKMVDMEAFAGFLQNHIKVGGKTNNLGSNVTVGLEGSKISVNVAAAIPFSKRCAILVIFSFSFFPFLTSPSLAF
jgi:hypothetical protein